MTILSIKEAAKAVGISKQTMYRRIQEGKVSCTKLPNNEKGIETSELVRAFETLVSQGVESTETLKEQSLEQAENERLLQMENGFLKKQVEQLTEDKRRLLDLFEQSQKTTEKLLEAPKRKRGIIEKIFGRARKRETEEI